MEKQAVQLVKDFVVEMLAGDWRLWRDFDLSALRDSDKFGCPQRGFDGDDCNIMRAVYSVLWGDFLPHLQMDNCGTRRPYRGDTMNTFHTMFGKENKLHTGFFDGLEKYSPSDEIRQRVRVFQKRCTSLGNYVVLPNFSARNTTLNCYRGCHEQWHDFFDRFLVELYQVQTGAVRQDAVLAELVHANSFCLDKFRGQDGFNEFAENLLLTDYCIDGVPGYIFAMNFHWMDENNAEQYFRDTELYLEKTASIINRRAEKMIQMLKNKVSGEDK